MKSLNIWSWQYGEKSENVNVEVASGIVLGKGSEHKEGGLQLLALRTMELDEWWDLRPLPLLSNTRGWWHLNRFPTLCPNLH